MEYIERRKDAEILCEVICGSERSLCVSKTENCQQKKMLELYKLPAADVVPVVRCRECKRWKPGDFMGGDDIDHMYRGGKCPIRRFAVYENDFCSKGERR